MSLELENLRLLHSIRQELYAYNNSDAKHRNPQRLIEEYFALLPEAVAIETYQKVVKELQENASQTGFDLEKWRVLSLQDAGIAKQEAKSEKAKTDSRNENNKKFRQEETIKQKIINELRYKGCDIEGKDLVSVSFEEGKRLLATFSDGSTQTINTMKYNGKPITPGFWKYHENSKERQNYLSQTQLQAIINANQMNFTTEYQASSSKKPASRKKSFEQYKKLAGNVQNIEKEYEIYHRLSLVNETKFLSEVKVRKAYMDNVSQIFNKLSEDAKNLSKLRLIADKTNLFNRISPALNISAKAVLYKEALSIIPTENVLVQNITETLTRLIDENIKGETGQQYVWSNFNKTEQNPRYSSYEILLDKAVNNSLMIHSEIFHFNDKQQMRSNIAKAISEIKSQNRSILPLSNSLASEILCIGVFNTGMKRAQNEEDLAKMNAILNEFGLNIRFEKRKITNIPPEETSNEYLRFQREAFRNDKAHKRFNEAFETPKLKNLLSKKEVHHFIPLRYNGFIDEELNQKSNYVAVASEHNYNIDFHGLGHTYDTPVSTLIENQEGQISSMTYATMRREGLGKTIMIPILQVKTAKGYEDALPAQSQKISTDKTPVCYAQIPDYITSSRYGLSHTNASEH